MKPSLSCPSVSLGEEIANAITHGIGAICSVVAAILLVAYSVQYAPAAFQTQMVVGNLVFGLSLFFLYLMSTLYHAVAHQKTKQVFQVLDHVAIYVLIAGSYTSFCLSLFHGAAGMRILIWVWALAVLGIVLQCVFRERCRIVSRILYLLMGWIVIVDYPMFQAQVDASTLRWVLFGGLAYTIGFVFYALQRYRWMHTIWHLFVLLGSFFHVVAASYAIIA